MTGREEWWRGTLAGARSTPPESSTVQIVFPCGCVLSVTHRTLVPCANRACEIRARVERGELGAVTIVEPLR